jgi:hypothetical protein
MPVNRDNELDLGAKDNDRRLLDDETSNINLEKA